MQNVMLPLRYCDAHLDILARRANLEQYVERIYVRQACA